MKIIAVDISFNNLLYFSLAADIAMVPVVVGQEGLRESIKIRAEDLSNYSLEKFSID